MQLEKKIFSLGSFCIARPYQICLLIVAVLAIYYPTMFAEVSLLDDREAISGMLNSETFDLKAIFIPRSTGGGYYRPLIGVSYAIDRFWWFLDSKIMHFENILIHLINTLMMFWVSVKLCKQHAEKTMLPFWGAMVFALHPINTESVNWISGRTDPIACLFVLAALLFVINYRENNNILLLLLAGIMTLLGVLAKETALGFIPASIFVILAEKKSDELLQKQPEGIQNHIIVFACYTSLAFLSALLFTNYYVVIVVGIAYWLHCLVVGNRDKLLITANTRLKTLFLVLTAFASFGLLFYGLRKAAFVSDISKISNTLQLMTADINYTIEIFMGAAGFYVKKFIVPTPLNIAIREIDPLYELFGVVCFMACVHLIYLRRVASALIIAGFLMLVPAFPFAFGTIAWTAFAERYDYIPSAFWILGSICFIQSIPEKFVSKIRKYSIFSGFILVCCFVWVTFERNIQWQTNLAIFKDGIEKSPEFKNVRGIYLTALYEDKQNEEAERQYFIAQKLHSIKYDERYDLLYASLLIRKKDYEKAEKVFTDVESKTKGQSVPLYNGMIGYYDIRLFDEKNSAVIKEIRAKKINAIERLYELNRSSHTAYILGQAYIAEGNFKKAHKFIKIAADQFEAKDQMKRNAEVLLKIIEKKTSKN